MTVSLPFVLLGVVGVWGMLAVNDEYVLAPSAERRPGQQEREYLLENYHNDVISSQSRADTLFEGWQTTTRRAGVRMSDRAINQGDKIANLTRRLTQLAEESKISPELSAAMLQSRVTETKVRYQWAACRASVAEIDSQLAMHKSRIESLGADHAKVAGPITLPSGHGVHVEDAGVEDASSGMVLLEEDDNMVSLPVDPVTLRAAPVEAPAPALAQAALENSMNMLAQTEAGRAKETIDFSEYKFPAALDQAGIIPATMERDYTGKAACDGPNGCGDHANIGKLFSGMLATSSATVDSLTARRETIIQPCQRKVQALEVDLRAAQRHVTSLQSHRLNHTAEMTMLKDVIKKLEFVKASGENMAQSRQRAAQQRQAEARRLSTTRDQELEVVDKLATMFAVTVDMDAREAEAQVRIQEDEEASLMALLTAEYDETRQRCTTNMARLVAEVTKAQDLLLLLEDMVALISATSEDSEHPDHNHAGQVALINAMSQALAVDSHITTLLQPTATGTPSLASQAARVRVVMDQKVAAAQAKVIGMTTSCTDMLRAMNARINEAI